MNVRVIGLGNVFMSDSGFGPYVVRVLEAAYEVPDAVQLIDGGSPGAELAPHLPSAGATILVESCATPGMPGDIRVSRAPGDAGAGDATFIGIVPEWCATGVTLSRPVRAAIAPVVALVVAELERLGYPPRLRSEPRHPDTWWERAELEAPAGA